MSYSLGEKASFDPLRDFLEDMLRQKASPHVLWSHASADDLLCP